MTEPETWGGWNRNVHSNPEKCGVELLATLEDPNACYDFSTIILVADTATGKLYAAHDAGCSCPIPFENVTGLGDMTEIRSGEEFNQLVRSHAYYGEVIWPVDEVLAVQRLIRTYLTKKGA